MTVIDIRPHRWGWKAFEAPGVEPVFRQKDQEQNIHVQHRGFAPDFFQSLSHFSAAVFHQRPKQLQHLIEVRWVAQL
jgi:hypothetical protein